MIRKTSNNERPELMNQVRKNREKNLYLYIDLVENGFEKESICTYVIENENNEIVLVIYEYYNSVQLLEISTIKDNQLEKLTNFLLEKKYKRISGSKKLLSSIVEHKKNKWSITYGYIMRFEKESKFDLTDNYETFFAAEPDFDEIAKLICSDSGMGKSYELNNLKKQLVNRYKNDNCENLCIKFDGKVVSHFAMYAVTEDIAVLSGMITSQEYKRKGMGSLLVRKLSMYVVQKNKTPYIYCYEQEYETWYQKLGYKIIGDCAKLELCNGE